MVEVTVAASVKIHGGPTLPVSATLTPSSYAVAAVELGPAGAADEEREIPLLPDGGTVVLLAVRARTAAGAPAIVGLTPSNGGTDGSEIEVKGTLLVTNSGVLAALVADGPRTVTVKNTGPDQVKVDIITGLNSA
jgi:hypothetical protein